MSSDMATRAGMLICWLWRPFIDALLWEKEAGATQRRYHEECHSGWLVKLQLSLEVLLAKDV